MSLFSEAEMADRTNQNLTHRTLRGNELGWVDADFLYCADAASSFLRALLNSRGEKHFTPILQGALHRLLHRSAAGKARQVNTIDVPKTVALRAGWHGVGAGAAPHFYSRCGALAVWSPPPLHELRVSVFRGCINRAGNFSKRVYDT